MAEPRPKYTAKYRSELTGWFLFSEVHWSRNLSDGSRLDYWPTKDKFKHGSHNKGPAKRGDVDAFIAEYEAKTTTAPAEWTEEREQAHRNAWHSYVQIEGDLSIYVVHPDQTGPEAATKVIEALHKVLEFYDREEGKAA